MPKQMIGARVPELWVSKPKALSETTGLNQTELIYQANGQYLGEDIATIGDRLSIIKGEVTAIKQRLGKRTASLMSHPLLDCQQTAKEFLLSQVATDVAGAVFEGCGIQYLLLKYAQTCLEQVAKLQADCLIGRTSQVWVVSLSNTRSIELKNHVILRLKSNAHRISGHLRK